MATDDNYLDPSQGSNLQHYKELYEDAKNARQPFEADWYLNLAFYKGFQWTFWNRGTLDIPQLDSDRVMTVDNRIMPSVDSRVARKTKQRPDWTATPATADDADSRSSYISEHLLDEQWDSKSLDVKWHRANKWAEICGDGFIKVGWDSTKGDKSVYLFLPDGNVATDANGKPLSAADMAPEAVAELGLTSQAIAMGDMRYDTISPFEFYPDPLANDLDECEYIVEEKIRSVQCIKERYGVDVKADADVPAGVVESRLIRQPSGALGGGASTVGKKGVCTYELWHDKCSDYPDGLWCVFTSEQVLKETTLDNAPYHGCPYIQVKCDPVPGQFWSSTPTTHLRGPQTELNKLLSQALENLQRIGNPTLMQSKHANVKWSGKPGERLYYESNVPDAVPSYLQPPEMPSYLQAQLERIEASITEISGIHEVSKASVPAGITAASAINLLQEADDTRLGPEMTLNEKSLGDLGDKTIRLFAKYADDQRVLVIVGEEGDYDIQEWKGTMLSSNINVSVQAGSTMTRSKAAKQAAMQETLALMLQYGVPIDPRSMRKFFKEFEVGGLDKLVSTINESELQVSREHQSFREGIPIDINSYDDDDYHIEAHEEFQRSKRHEMLDPIFKEYIQAHVDAHRERRTQMISKQAQMQGYGPSPVPTENGVGNGYQG
jgi:hypothetical protein